MSKQDLVNWRSQAHFKKSTFDYTKSRRWSYIFKLYPFLISRVNKTVKFDRSFFYEWRKVIFDFKDEEKEIP